MAEKHMVLRWEAFEHDHIERGADWYWALAIIAVSIALISILLHNVLFAVVILIAALTLALVSRTPPDLASFELSDRGVRVNGALHRFDEIISFWVEDEHDHRPLLLVDTKKFLSPNLIIPIEGIDPRLVRTYLKERCTEKLMKEPLAHKMLEFFGL